MEFFNRILMSRRAPRFAVLSWLVLSSAGCSSVFRSVVQQNSPASGSTQVVSSRVLGGKSGVAGATIQLYAAGTMGYGSGATALLQTPAVSDANGNFSLPSDFACPAAEAPVYLLAVGGDAGGGYNANLSLVSALGACSEVGTTPVVINSLTTVAAIYALTPFMNSPTKIGTDQSNHAGLSNAFTTAKRLVDPATGHPASALPSGTILPVTTMDTLASLLAVCVDTNGGASGDNSPCGRLFAAAAISGMAAPGDTAAALLAIASHPARNVASLLALLPSDPAFAPVSSALKDFSLSIRYKPSLKKPSAVGIDASGNLWITNAGDGTVSIVSNDGVPLSGSPLHPAGLVKPSAIGLDSNDTGWITDAAGNNLTALRLDGSSTLTRVTGLNVPQSIAVDSQGLLWIVNQGNNSVTAVTPNGMAVQGAQTYQPPGIMAPHAIVFNPF